MWENIRNIKGYSTASIPNCVSCEERNDFKPFDWIKIGRNHSMSWTSDIFKFSEILVVLIVSKHSYILTLGGAQLSNLGVKAAPLIIN